MAKLEYFAGGDRLVVSINEDSPVRYSTLFVESAERMVLLGSESLEMLKDKCIATLSTISTQKTGVYDGVRVFQVIILGEPHAALLASPLNDGGINLYLLDICSIFRKVMTLVKSDLDRLIVFLQQLN
jgi:hypothetical protein